MTASTYHKELLFNTVDKLDRLVEDVFAVCEREEWSLQAWAVFPNHYHLIAFSLRDEADPRLLAKAIHGRSGVWINEVDVTPGRRVWYRAWDTALTYEKSYLARLHYVHENPVRHGVVKNALDYKWCSAKWFEDSADRPFVRTVRSFPIDKVQMLDDFEVVWPASSETSRAE